mgnify:CR=1 FL=1|nr:MAG TPA: hypothetical protein [Caudoviricetes sp.]
MPELKEDIYAYGGPNRQLADLDVLHSEIQRIISYRDLLGTKVSPRDTELVLSLAKQYKETLDRVIQMVYGVSPNDHE